MLAIALIVIGGLFSFGAACAYLISAAIAQAEHDLADSNSYGDCPFVPRLCDCEFNFPLCDSRCCPIHPEVRSPRADRGGGVVVFGVPATIREVSSSHSPAGIR